MMNSGQQPARLGFRVYDETIEPGSQAWQFQQTQLFKDIKLSGGKLVPAPPSPSDASEGAVSRTKGGPDLLYLVMAATAVQGVIQILRLWLRERSRAVVFEWTDGDETRTWRITGAVSDETLREILAHAVDQGLSP
jgi:hypothetical protein